MSETLRTLQRRANTSGNPADAALVLAERLRRGEIDLEHVELAAYVGNEAARLVAGYPQGALVTPVSVSYIPCEDLPLTDWARGLNRWGQAVSVRAAVAAGQVAHHKHMHCSGACPQTDALDAAQVWLDCPCEKHRLACNHGIDLIEGNPGPWFGILYAILYWGSGAARSSIVQSIERSASLSKESDVRDAICKSLVTWALA